MELFQIRGHHCKDPVAQIGAGRICTAPIPAKKESDREIHVPIAGFHPNRTNGRPQGIGNRSEKSPRMKFPPTRSPEYAMKFIATTIALAFSATAICADNPVDYQRDIKPLLEVKCYACHGSLKQEADLRLDAGVLFLPDDDQDGVVVPGDASASRILERITAEDIDERMPPEGEGEALDDKQIALITAWINQGANVPDDEQIPDDPRNHWAYQSVVRPDVPYSSHSNDVHPIDAFVAEQHRHAGLIPAKQADPHTLLRRLNFDLAGLPPTRDDIRQFMDDTAPDVWERTVDRLLDRPQYGERWGRHWMDVWRYSDWDGFKAQVRGSQKHIWHWRDWIVESLNEDKGYDRMIVEMLAGDEIAPEDPSVLAATGFLARNFHVTNRNIWLDATVEHTARAFLGMTLNCARCHDHKYDPIAQQEYYQFRAIFEPHKVRTDRLPGEANLAKDGLPRAYDADLSAATYLYIRGNEKQPDEDNPLAPAVPSAAGGEFNFEPVELPLQTSYPSLVAFVIEEDLDKARRDVEQADQQLAEAQSGDATTDDSIAKRTLARTVASLRLSSLEARIAADRAKAGFAESTDDADLETLTQNATRLEHEWKLRQAELKVAEHESALAQVTIDEKKDAKQKAAAKKMLAQAKASLQKVKVELNKNDATYTPLGEEYPRTSSGRRLALARWMTSPNNPLTARVAVNHIWMRHFGAPLVNNMDDFGLRSPRPQYADLLDWLAAELKDNHWSMKHLHRLILTSHTWQLASSTGSADDRNRQIDPDNQLFWRANVRRLDAEVVRDSVLAASGQLDLTLGGQETGFQNADNSVRRSLYVQHAYEKQATMLVLFDAASPNECYKRSESIIPQQALALANSSLALSQARHLARNLSEDISEFDDASQERFVRQAFLQMLSRPPAASEFDACLEFLQNQADTLSDPSGLTRFSGGAKPKLEPATDPRSRARENLIHVLMNHNDFITTR